MPSATATPLSTARAVGSNPRKPRISKKAQAAVEQERRAFYARKLFEELNHAIFDDKLPKETKLNWNGVQTTEIELAEKILDCD
ncbi:hypothetical protein C0991_010698, partial [Blastosporella zonata]